MYRDIDKARTRKEFVTMCMNNPINGAKHLHVMAQKLSKCKTSREVVEHLSNLLYVTDRTIYRDCITEDKSDNS